jgi:hypothetical protein
MMVISIRQISGLGKQFHATGATDLLMLLFITLLRILLSAIPASDARILGNVKLHNNLLLVKRITRRIGYE